MICVRCEQPIDEEDLADTRLGPMHEKCYETLPDGDSYETTDHGDSVWPH